MVKLPIFETLRASARRALQAPVQFWALLLLASAAFLFLPEADVDLDMIMEPGHLHETALFLGHNFIALAFFAAIAISLLDASRGTQSWIGATLLRGLFCSIPIALLTSAVFLLALLFFTIQILVVPKSSDLIMFAAPAFALLMVAIFFVLIPTLVDQRKGFRSVRAAYELTRGNRWPIVTMILAVYPLTLILVAAFRVLLEASIFAVAPYLFVLAWVPSIAFDIICKAIYAACIVEVYTRLSDDRATCSFV